MVEFEKIIYDLVGKVSVLETKVSMLQERVVELEGSKNMRDITSDVQSGGRDKTRYSLDGEVYLKNRFVWAVVQKYVSEHRNITFEELRAVFGDRNQGSKFGVVQNKESEIVKKNPIRYFVKKESDIIEIADCEIVICNNWSKDTVTNIFDIAVKLGYSVKKV